MSGSGPENLFVQRDTYDVILIGGGIMGCATAYHLMRTDRGLRVGVVEPDPTYSRASTTLSMANVRIQFSLRENIQVSLYAMDMLERFEEDMAVDGEKPFLGYRKEGNLFLVDEAGREAAERALALQQSLGCEISWWSPDRIRERYPLYHMENLVGGTFGARDGLLDAYGFLMGYKAKAKKLGAIFIREEVTEILREGDRVRGVRLTGGEALCSEAVVNCAGAWAAGVARTAGVVLPVVPVKRQIFALDTAVKPEGPLPLTILPSGLYFRTETGHLILLGKSMEDDAEGFDFRWDEKRFVERLWPELAAFVPAFDTLKVIRGWAGLYAVNTLDGNAVLGEWPELKGLFMANGFSGHGLQQAPAVGRYLSECILKKPVSLDLSVFRPDRILEKKPLSEGGLV